MTEPRYNTPEGAARGDIPEEHLRVLGVLTSSDEAHAIVLLDAHPVSGPYTYQVVCERDGDHWVEGIGGNGPGWSLSTVATDAAMDLGVATAWGIVPTGAASAIVGFKGEEFEAEVANGYYVFAVWGVPDDVMELLRLLRFT